MDALALLQEDHQKVLGLLARLERGPEGGRAAVTPLELREYRDLVTELVMAQSAHEAVEEQYFWPSVRRWLESGRELAGPALEQERQAKKLPHRIDQLDAADHDLVRLAEQVIGNTREHIAYEEQQVWPIVRALMASSELDALGEKMRRAKAVAPTRPHPDTPPVPGVLKTVGLGAAVIDKLRDTVTGRGGRHR